MGLFGRLKNSGSASSVVWRDSTGKIRCPGDSCPADCDNSCPIYLSSNAGMMLQFGQEAMALQYLEKAAELAPDFYDAWQNMAAIYGGKGMYQKAHDCYEKAHKIWPGRPAPLFGLALSSRDLKLYEECLKWCDEYDKVASDHRLDDTRRIAKMR